MLKQLIDNGLTCGIANSEDLLRKIYSLREILYKIESPYLLNQSEVLSNGMETYDLFSYNFYISIEDEIVGSSRCTPYVENKWEITESLCDINLDELFDPNIYLQFNRLLINPAYRNMQIHEVLFYYVCNWITSNTKYRKYFSVCRPSLVRIYQNYGAKLIFDQPVGIKNRQLSEYYLIEGNADEVIYVIGKKRPELASLLV